MRLLLATITLLAGCAAPTLLSVRWVDGRGDIAPDGAPLVWRHEDLPLGYVVSAAEHERDWQAVVDAAAKVWNDCVGLRLLTPVSRPELAAIVVIVNGETAPSGATTLFYGTSRPHTVRIVIHAVVESLAGYTAVAHELGHALGLAHGGGIMRPRVLEGDTTGTLFHLVPLQSQCALLRATYTRHRLRLSRP